MHKLVFAGSKCCLTVKIFANCDEVSPSTYGQLQYDELHVGTYIGVFCNYPASPDGECAGSGSSFIISVLFSEPQRQPWNECRINILRWSLCSCITNQSIKFYLTVYIENMPLLSF